jgi:hypothetical protein
LTDRPLEGAAPETLRPHGRGDVLARALSRARLTILWERLWPALAAVAVAVGLFLAVSWIGTWLWLPPIGRAIGLGLFFLLTAAAFAPMLLSGMWAQYMVLIARARERGIGDAEFHPQTTRIVCGRALARPRGARCGRRGARRAAVARAGHRDPCHPRWC